MALNPPERRTIFNGDDSSSILDCMNAMNNWSYKSLDRREFIVERLICRIKEAEKKQNGAEDIEDIEEFNNNCKKYNISLEYGKYILMAEFNYYVKLYEFSLGK